MESGSYHAPLLSETVCCLRWPRYPLYDGTGSLRGLVDASGVQDNTYRFDSFGRALAGNTVTPLQSKYGGAWGYRTDSRTDSGTTGLIQTGARWYWPEIGRYTQQDPAGAGDNWYAYAGNNPVTGIDPEGLVPVAGVDGFPGDASIYVSQTANYAAKESHDHTVGRKGLAGWLGDQWNGAADWYSKWGPHAAGLGLQMTGLVGSLMGAGAEGEFGRGLFSSGGLGDYVSGGAFFGLPGGAYTSPRGAYGPLYPYVYGLYGGIGAQGWISNAHRAEDLTGPGVSGTIGLGLPPPFNFGLSFALGQNGTYVVSVSPPGASWGVAGGAMCYGSTTVGYSRPGGLL